MTLLAIDVGNTRLKWALFDRPGQAAHLLAHGAEFLENIDKLAEGPWAPKLQGYMLPKFRRLIYPLRSII